MIGFFEKITGVPYAWPKYDQIVGRDYVSGAMENTTATLHQESAYQNARQLVDGNNWEDVIAHEFFINGLAILLQPKAGAISP